jgi:FkbM family methyltransferase
MAYANENQDELVWEFFGRRPAGFFLEVGANHPTEGSQTWLLEQKGWRGILVEPQAALAGLLRAGRAGSQVVQAACGPPEKVGEATLYVPEETLVGFATLERNVDDPHVRYTRTERVEVLTLETILQRAGNPQVDFLSIDTEGTEVGVLQGLDLAKRKPALILIEDKLQDLSKHAYLRRHGYVLVKRTELNDWYVPQGTRFTMTSMGEKLALWRKVFLGLPSRKLRRWRHARRAQSQPGSK